MSWKWTERTEIAITVEDLVILQDTVRIGE